MSEPARPTLGRAPIDAILVGVTALVGDDQYPEYCPHVIKLPTMRMIWDQLTMIHWRYPVEDVQRLIPDRLTVETFDGSAWVGLIPFRMRIDLPVLPDMPSILHFPETNVRTYVTDRRGRPGVWFFSLEASSPLAVMTARTTYRVPYYWADMSIEQPEGAEGDEERYLYRSKRRWPGPKGASSVVDVTVGDAFGAGEVGPLDRFLTARWALYGTLGPLTVRANMFHERWPLHHATLHRCDDELVGATGLSEPTGDPVVHSSPGVNVRCGWPTRA